MKRIFLILGMMSFIAFGSTACAKEIAAQNRHYKLMVIPPTQTQNRNLGTMTVVSSSLDTITFQTNKMSTFSFEKLYSLHNLSTGKSYWFKFAGSYFTAPTNKTTLVYVQWHDDIYPNVKTPVTYEVSEWDWKANTTQTINMIGDSITGDGCGSALRGYMHEDGSSFLFAGNRIDLFGLMHSGVGGDTTQKILNRKEQLPVSDVYFIWAGTNDWSVAPYDGGWTSVSNILTLIDWLKANKNKNARFYIGGLLHRNDAADVRNMQVNTLWQSMQLPENTKFIDLASQLPQMPIWYNYLADGVHPNFEGYSLIASILAKRIE